MTYRVFANGDLHSEHPTLLKAFLVARKNLSVEIVIDDTCDDIILITYGEVTVHRPDFSIEYNVSGEHKIYSNLHSGNDGAYYSARHRRACIRTIQRRQYLVMPPSQLYHCPYLVLGITGEDEIVAFHVTDQIPYITGELGGFAQMVDRAMMDDERYADKTTYASEVIADAWKLRRDHQPNDVTVSNIVQLKAMIEGKIQFFYQLSFNQHGETDMTFMVSREDYLRIQMSQ